MHPGGGGVRRAAHTKEPTPHAACLLWRMVWDKRSTTGPNEALAECVLQLATLHGNVQRLKCKQEVPHQFYTCTHPNHVGPQAKIDVAWRSRCCPRSRPASLNMARFRVRIRLPLPYPIPNPNQVDADQFENLVGNGPRGKDRSYATAGGGGGQLRVIGAHFQLAPGPSRFGWPQTRWCLSTEHVETHLHGMSGSLSCDVAAPLTGTIAVATIATFLVRV